MAPIYGGLAEEEPVASKQHRMHGRVEGAADRCAKPGCAHPGEFKAPLTGSSFDGPGQWQWLCLEHVREHNARYNYFTGMSPDEIEAAQSPVAAWDRSTRTFAHVGGDPAPKWSDFRDPLEAIGGRFGNRFREREDLAEPRFSGPERRALEALGLGPDADLQAVRKRYSELVRRYHPDRNGGDRSQESKLRAVIDAWQVLNAAPAFG